MNNSHKCMQFTAAYRARVAELHGHVMRRRIVTDPATTPAKNPFGDIAPALGRYTDDVLFGDVWLREGLSPRDRSLVTVACLVALYRQNELPSHLKRALDNGLTRDELIETITHLAFYSGWPTAATAIGIARKVFNEISGAAPDAVTTQR